jgi:hypothetical protein
MTRIATVGVGALAVGAADFAYNATSTPSNWLLGGYVEYEEIDPGKFVLPGALALAFGYRAVTHLDQGGRALFGFDLVRGVEKTSEIKGNPQWDGVNREWVTPVSTVQYRQTTPSPRGWNRVAMVVDKALSGAICGAASAAILYGGYRSVTAVEVPFE